MEYLVARVYPNDLLLGDIYLQNPDAPLSAGSPNAEFRRYKGFGLLPKLIENLLIYARENNCDFITLTAAGLDNIPLFESLGFAVEDNDMAKNGLKVGYGIPMELKLK